eukprot:TRINITY_DN5586_c0_g1_i1.p1 TRINITY_DN5586_c0_g1~~TRINITY_DN5586_c0_g1_i1.p1  ORF type:complete len:981 (+),score=349.97 TRINITY_DN5586_c0_g1_i1:77-3019(+)
MENQMMVELKKRNMMSIRKRDDKQENICRLWCNQYLKKRDMKLMESLLDGMKTASNAIVVLEEASGLKCANKYVENPKKKHLFLDNASVAISFLDELENRFGNNNSNKNSFTDNIFFEKNESQVIAFVWRAICLFGDERTKEEFIQATKEYKASVVENENYLKKDIDIKKSNRPGKLNDKENVDKGNDVINEKIVLEEIKEKELVLKRMEEDRKEVNLKEEKKKVKVIDEKRLLKEKKVKMKENFPEKEKPSPRKNLVAEDKKLSKKYTEVHQKRADNQSDDDERDVVFMKEPFHIKEFDKNKRLSKKYTEFHNKIPSVDNDPKNRVLVLESKKERIKQFYERLMNPNKKLQKELICLFKDLKEDVINHLRNKPSTFDHHNRLVKNFPLTKENKEKLVDILEALGDVIDNLRDDEVPLEDCIQLMDPLEEIDDWNRSKNDVRFQDDIDAIHDFLGGMFTDDGDSDTDEYDRKRELNEKKQNFVHKTPVNQKKVKRLIEKVYGSYDLRIIKLYVTMVQSKLPLVDGEITNLVSVEIIKLLDCSTLLLKESVKLRKKIENVGQHLVVDRNLQRHLIHTNYLLSLFPVIENNRKVEKPKRNIVEILMELKREFRMIMEINPGRRSVPSNNVESLTRTLVDELDNVFKVFDDRDAIKELDLHYKKFLKLRNNFMGGIQQYLDGQLDYREIKLDFEDIKKSLAGFRDIVYQHSDYKRKMLEEEFENEEIEPDEEQFYMWSKFQAGTLRLNKSKKFSSLNDTGSDHFTIRSAKSYLEYEDSKQDLSLKFSVFKSEKDAADKIIEISKKSNKMNVLHILDSVPSKKLFQFLHLLDLAVSKQKETHPKKKDINYPHPALVLMGLFVMKKCMKSLAQKPLSTSPHDPEKLKLNLFKISSYIKSSIYDFDLSSFSEHLFSFLENARLDVLSMLLRNALLKVSHDIILTFCWGISTVWYKYKHLDDVEDIWQEITNVLLNLINEIEKMIDD